MLGTWPAGPRGRSHEPGGQMAVIEVRDLAKRCGEQVAVDGF
jgi:hypothetical protein